MSGGVDCAVAALLCAREGARGRSPSRSSCGADAENDAERSCCSAQRGRAARARSRTGWACRTSRSTCATSSAPASSSRGCADHARGPDAEPVRALQRPRAARRDARARRAARRARRSRPATTRASTTDGLLRVAADPAKDQSYMLAALDARVARAAALPARRADQAARCASSPARGRPAGRAQARLAGPLLPRRHRAARRSSPATAASRERPGDDRRRAPAGRSARHRGAARASPSASARGLGVGGAASRSTCSATDARANTVTVGPARGAAARAACGRATCALHRPGRARSTASSCATAPRRSPCALRGDELAARRAGLGRRARPDRRAAAGRRRRRLCDDRPMSRVHGRDPRDVPRVLRVARAPAPPVGLARARDVRRVRAADDGGNAPAQALFPRASRSRPRSR